MFKGQLLLHGLFEQLTTIFPLLKLVQCHYYYYSILIKKRLDC